MFKTNDFGDNTTKFTIVAGAYSVSILDRGAILQSFKYKDRDIVLGYDDIYGYINNDNYFGEVVGPFANRIKNATYKDALGVHVLDKNDGDNNLHSGSKNYGYKKWRLKEFGDDYLILNLVSKKEGGFPSSEDVSVCYSLSENGEMRIDYEVSADTLCPVNITNHAFFNLNGYGDILSHTLSMPSSHYIEVDSQLIPTKIMPSEKTDFDFTSPVEIGKRRDGKYDHCFILDKPGDIVLEGNELKLRFKTDLPSVQLYTGSALKSNQKGKYGIDYGSFSGLCLETEYYPDFVSRKDFKGAWSDQNSIVRTSTSFILEAK